MHNQPHIIYSSHAWFIVSKASLPSWFCLRDKITFFTNSHLLHLNKYWKSKQINSYTTHRQSATYSIRIAKRLMAAAWKSAFRKASETNGKETFSLFRRVVAGDSFASDPISAMSFLGFGFATRLDYSFNHTALYNWFCITRSARSARHLAFRIVYLSRTGMVNCCLYWDVLDIEISAFSNSVLVVWSVLFLWFDRECFLIVINGLSGAAESVYR